MTRALLLVAVAACGAEAAPVTLTIVEPVGTAELLPGRTVDLVWRLDGGGAEVVATMTELNTDTPRPIHDAHTPAGTTTFTWDGRDLGGALLRPAVYDLEVVAEVDGAAADGATLTLAVHGIRVTDPAPGAVRVVRGSDVPVDLTFVTVSHRVLALATSVGDVVIDERTIPGELVAFSRAIRFDGAGVPAGVHRVTVAVTDADSDLAYEVTGGEVDWRPLE